MDRDRGFSGRPQLSVFRSFVGPVAAALWLALCLTLSLAGCVGGRDVKGLYSAPGLPRGSAYVQTKRLPGTCGAYGAPVVMGTLPPVINEASGLVVSSWDAKVLWTHNDGPDAKLYAVRGRDGALQATVTFPRALALPTTDWEDLASGPCGNRRTGQRCLYIADTGNNNGLRGEVRILRIPEPDPHGGDAQLKLGEVEQLLLRYPKLAPGEADKAMRKAMARSIIKLGGGPLRRILAGTKPPVGHPNVEAMWVDDGGVVWLLDKGNRTTSLYRVPFQAGQASAVRVKTFAAKALMPWQEGRAARITGADWRPGRLVVRSYGGLWESCGLDHLVSAPWRRIDSTFARKGEAVAYAHDGIWHVPEGKGARLSFLPRRSKPALKAGAKPTPSQSVDTTGAGR